MTEKQAKTIRDIPENLWRKVKARAALKGQSVKNYIIELLEKAVENGNLEKNDK